MLKTLFFRINYKVLPAQGIARGSFLRRLDSPFPLWDGHAAAFGIGDAARIPIQPSVIAPNETRKDLRRSFCSVILWFGLIQSPLYCLKTPEAQSWG